MGKRRRKRKKRNWDALIKQAKKALERAKWERENGIVPRQTTDRCGKIEQSFKKRRKKGKKKGK